MEKGQIWSPKDSESLATQPDVNKTNNLVIGIIQKASTKFLSVLKQKCDFRSIEERPRDLFFVEYSCKVN